MCFPRNVKSSVYLGRYRVERTTLEARITVGLWICIYDGESIAFGRATYHLTESSLGTAVIIIIILFVLLPLRCCFAGDRQLRNVQRFITEVHIYCFAHGNFCFLRLRCHLPIFKGPRTYLARVSKEVKFHFRLIASSSFQPGAMLLIYARARQIWKH